MKKIIILVKLNKKLFQNVTSVKIQWGDGNYKIIWTGKVWCKELLTTTGKTLYNSKENSKNYSGAEADFSRKEQIWKMGIPSSRNSDFVRESMIVAHWMPEKRAELPWVRTAPWSPEKPETSLQDTIQTAWREVSLGYSFTHPVSSNTIGVGSRWEKSTWRDVFASYSVSLLPSVDNLNMMQVAKKNYTGPKSIFIEQAMRGRFGA